MPLAIVCGIFALAGAALGAAAGDSKKK